ncbi:MAG: P-loop NTPase [Elusimicrobia bacterium]|nr:P-loop NTPase [Elusimicrobiota bacterium]
MKHMDEARKGAEKTLSDIVAGEESLKRAVLIDDLFGRFRLVFWAKASSADIVRQTIHRKLDAALKEAAGPYWSGEIWDASKAGTADRLVYDKAWETGRPSSACEKLRLADRRRNRGAWFEGLSRPPWTVLGEQGVKGPPIIVFYSFKGGVGRSTAMAAFALQRARLGERVAVVDMDLDAPGIGTLLAADSQGMTAHWGVLDYLLERSFAQPDLRDYYHAFRPKEIAGSGEILVVPAGRLDEFYLGKLARVDLEPVSTQEKHALVLLLEAIRSDLKPNWLLLDARAGLSEPAGFLLGGLAHLHVLFGTTSEQSWLGLKLVLERIGAERVRQGQPQLDCLLVQAMVAEDPTAAANAKAVFMDRARDTFADCYYAPDPESPEDDLLWYIRDMEDSDAPHSPVAISYQPKLAHFNRLDETIVDHLTQSAEYRALDGRIAARFLEVEK